jgi:hypothetical protein
MRVHSIHGLENCSSFPICPVTFGGWKVLISWSLRRSAEAPLQSIGSYSEVSFRFSAVAQRSLPIPLNKFTPQKAQFTPKNPQSVPYPLIFCPISVKHFA